MRRNNRNRNRNRKGRNLGMNVQEPTQVTYNSSNVQAFPDRYVTTLIYEDTQGITGANPYASYIYRGNSVFDPDYTGIGHQPTGFDNLAALYGRYRVLSSEITCSALNNAGNTPAVICVIPNTDILTYTSVNEWKESFRAKKSATIPVAGYGTRNVTHRCTTGAILGLNDVEKWNEDTASDVGTNPGHVWYWNVVALNMLVTGVNLSVDIRIKYRVEFFDKVNPGLSRLHNNFEKLSHDERRKLTGLEEGSGYRVDPTKVEIVNLPIPVILSTAKNK